jgi:plastocyanin
MKTRRIFISLLALLMFAIIFSGSALAALCIPSNVTKIPSSVQNKDALASTLSQQNATVNVTIVNFAFTPSNITITNGTTVVWTNKEAFISHSVVSDRKAFNSGTGTFSPIFDSGSLSPGASFEFQFNATGTFNYYCREHPFMHGTVIVT